MFEFVKSEKLFDWNANEAFISMPETNTPLIESGKFEKNSSEKLIDSKKVITKQKVPNKPKVKNENKLNKLKVCTTVRKNHFGPIPGIPVGTCWEKRVQVSEAGVHRPPVAGIHGRENEGAYSIVFSGTYAEDKDFGDEFFYSGCGGGITDPSKFITGQMCDQTLTSLNKALAVSCNAPVNDEVGADAEDWKAGKPIRVVRTYKLKKHSKFAPDEGQRYDGIYKVVKYFPIIGQSGLLVWRFLLRRDDPEPAPWTDEGKQAISEKNMQIIRAEKKAYVRTLCRPAKKQYVKKLSQKSPLKNSVYPFSDQKALDIITREVSQASDDVQDEEWLPKKWKSKKSKKRNSKLKLKKSQTQNAAKNQKTRLKSTKTSVQSSKPSYKRTGFQFFNDEACEKIIDLEMRLASTNAGNTDANLQVSQGLLESPRKRQRKQKFNDLLNADSYYGNDFNENGQKALPNAQIDFLTFPTSEMKMTYENDCTESEEVEIVPDLSFLQECTSPGPLEDHNYNRKLDGSLVVISQPEESATKLSIKVSSVMSLQCKNVAVSCETPRNKKRNTGRNRITDATEQLKIQNQVDLTIEEEDKPYTLPVKVEKFIDSDTLNKTIWEYCRKNFLKSETEFLNMVRLMFTCRYCNQLAANPVTTPCDHNVCLECISNHFLKQIFSCPDCRNNLNLGFKLVENRNLSNALESLFPGYNLRY